MFPEQNPFFSLQRNNIKKFIYRNTFCAGVIFVLLIEKLIFLLRVLLFFRCNVSLVFYFAMGRGFDVYLLRLQSVEFFFKDDTLRPLCFLCSENHVRVLPAASSCGSYRSALLIQYIDFKKMKFTYSL